MIWQSLGKYVQFRQWIRRDKLLLQLSRGLFLLCGLSSMKEGLILLHVGSSSQLYRTYVYGILRYVMAHLVLNTVRAILEDFQEKTNFITSRYCKTLHSIWHNEFAFNKFSQMNDIPLMIVLHHYKKKVQLRQNDFLRNEKGRFD